MTMGGIQADPLARIRPFEALTAAERVRLAAQTEELRVDREHVFFEEGETADQVFVAQTGRVRIQHFRPDGSVRTVCMVGPGDTFCCLPTLDGGPYPATAVAAEPSVVFRIPGPTYRSLLEANPAFARVALKQFCGRLREAGCEGCAQADDVGSRLAGKILTLADKFGDLVPVTRKELAELAGTTIETAIRITRDFERQGWLELSRGKFRVTDRDALARRALGPTSPVQFTRPARPA
jgi:CRP-like cAMP-binding protein